MPRTHALPSFAFLALGLACLGTACETKAQPTPPPAATQVAPKPQPTDAAALERSRKYWVNAEKADWVANYDMLCAEIQREQAPAMYLSGKQNHIYKNMRVMEVVAHKDDMIFLRIGGLWTPNHPRVKEVRLEPGQTLTQDVELIEIWRWEAGEWKYVRPLRSEEFLEQFPDLQPSANPPAVPPAPAK